MAINKKDTKLIINELEERLEFASWLGGEDCDDEYVCGAPDDLGTITIEIGPENNNSGGDN